MKYSIITTAYNQLDQLKKALPYWQEQSFTDFEWVIGDDGSGDGVIDWCKTNGIKSATHPHLGYRFTVACRLALDIAEGEYLVFIPGDCYPHKDFLQEIDSVIAENKVVNGMRIQVDMDGNIVGPDWRAEAAPFPLDAHNIPITNAKPWEFMTLTSLCLSRKKFDELGGLFSGYDEGYGKMDWDLAANAYYKGMELVWNPHALVYHVRHPERTDTENSTKVFYDRLRQFQKEKTI